MLGPPSGGIVKCARCGAGRGWIVGADPVGYRDTNYVPDGLWRQRVVRCGRCNLAGRRRLQWLWLCLGVWWTNRRVRSESFRSFDQREFNRFWSRRLDLLGMWDKSYDIGRGRWPYMRASWVYGGAGIGVGAGVLMARFAPLLAAGLGFGLVVASAWFARRAR